MPLSDADKTFSAREFAAMATAIAWLRNELIWIHSSPDAYDTDRIGRLIDSTATQSLERALQLPENALAIEREKYITKEEEDTIAAKHRTVQSSEPP